MVGVHLKTGTGTARNLVNGVTPTKFIYKSPTKFIPKKFISNLKPMKKSLYCKASSEVLSLLMLLGVLLYFYLILG